MSFHLVPPDFGCRSVAGSNTQWSCERYDSCAGFRSGQLCGSCMPGYTEGFGSPECVDVSQCAADAPLVWSLVACGVVAAALLQLAFVSEVWRPSATYPTGKIKLGIYYFQMVGFVSSNHAVRTRATQLGDALTAVFRLQMPTQQSYGGAFCLLPSFDATGKVLLDVVLAVAVAVVMAVVYIGVALLTRSWRCVERKVSRGDVDSDLRGSKLSVQLQIVGVSEPLLSGVDAAAHDSEGAYEDDEVGTTSSAHSESALTNVARGHGTAAAVDHDQSQAELTSHHLTVNSAKDSESESARECKTDARNDDRSATTAVLATSSDSDTTAVDNWDDGRSMSTRARLYTAGINLGLSVYSSLTVAAVKMLHCVHIPGTPTTSSHLFIQGVVECDLGGWQVCAGRFPSLP